MSERPPPGSPENRALLLAELGRPDDPDDENRWRQAFWDFHRENRHVLDRIEVLIDKVLTASPKAIFGIELIIAQLRWEHYFETTDPDFKLNDGFTAYYARMVILRHPEWDGLFKFKYV